ncbi:hypothetical protein CIG75_10540 [Tumebacillus algifaecis]|uniref:Uncharacterized protein n=1 Tax=Tumebacillus algifaecis TaxID=1214604 RepID=A0A223D1P9_9BACL|nr:hypothetical protein [Tumebacillus algifaecis]ASS75385.1 hypothetical protein CIG75_10540 [Tumebacillus algifaecis]
MTELLMMALFLLVVLIGYALGRRVGHVAGMREGRILSHIELREESLRKGVCPICDKSYLQ